MKLSTLRHESGADLSKLSKLIEGRSWKSALPAALPEEALLSLTQDFRSVERAMTSQAPQDDEVRGLAQAMFVVLQLLMQHPRCPGGGVHLAVTQDGLAHALQLYQIALEREVVARITGIETRESAEEFAEALWRAAKT
jgi:hypothetical protein